jgi:hypothetical protein
MPSGWRHGVFLPQGTVVSRLLYRQRARVNARAHGVALARCAFGETRLLRAGKAP